MLPHFLGGERARLSPAFCSSSSQTCPPWPWYWSSSCWPSRVSYPTPSLWVPSGAGVTERQALGTQTPSERGGSKGPNYWVSLGAGADADQAALAEDSELQARIMGDKRGAQTPGVLKQEDTGAPNPRVPGRRGSWGQDSLRQERARRLDSWGQGSIESRILRWVGRWKPGHLDPWEQRELRPRLLNPSKENLWAQMTVSCKRRSPRTYLLGTEARGSWVQISG